MGYYFIELLANYRVCVKHCKTFNQALDWVNAKIAAFKKANNVIDEKKDKHFQLYKNELKSALQNQVNEQNIECAICSPEKYTPEGYCKCVGRNIALAKFRRENGKKPKIGK